MVRGRLTMKHVFVYFSSLFSPAFGFKGCRLHWVSQSFYSFFLFFYRYNKASQFPAGFLRPFWIIISERILILIPELPLTCEYCQGLSVLQGHFICSCLCETTQRVCIIVSYRRKKNLFLNKGKKLNWMIVFLPSSTLFSTKPKKIICCWFFSLIFHTVIFHTHNLDEKQILTQRSRLCRRLCS